MQLAADAKRYLLVDVLLEIGGVERQAHGVHAVVDVVDGSSHGLTTSST